MREWVMRYRPVRQRTVRGETTKDKCGTLPPHVYAMQYIPSETPFIIRAHAPDVVGDHGNAADIPFVSRQSSGGGKW